MATFIGLIMNSKCQQTLSNYSNKSTTIDSLQKDSEFQNLLTDARQAAKEVGQAEQKSVCEDVLNYEE